MRVTDGKVVVEMVAAEGWAAATEGKSQVSAHLVDKLALELFEKLEVEVIL